MKVKYPRTPHLPWSDGIASNDKVIESLDNFKNQRVIVTEKVDGENTTMYYDAIHARSLDYTKHPSRNWVKNFWSTIREEIPFGWRVCGENLFAKHSIYYENLPSYFLGFSVFNDKNICLNWENTIDFFSQVGIIPVQVLFDGIYCEQAIKNILCSLNVDKCEGYVVRIAGNFKYEEFRYNTAKYVRKNHVSTDEHWMSKPLEINNLYRK